MKTHDLKAVMQRALVKELQEISKKTVHEAVRMFETRARQAMAQAAVQVSNYVRYEEFGTTLRVELVLLKDDK